MMLGTLLSCYLLIQGDKTYHFNSSRRTITTIARSGSSPSTTTAPAKIEEEEALILSSETTSRRNLFRSASVFSVGGLLAGGISNFDISPAIAVDDLIINNNNIATPLYFGVGCFWHIQHEFIEQGEKKILGRKPTQYTSLAGYAGGKSTDKEGRVCYHNFQGVADYGKLGHSEVVGMTIPQNKIEDFAELYFSLYNPKTKERVDPQDIGGEYRSLFGLPGGMNHASYPLVESAATKAGFKVVEGKGNDGDTLGKQIVYVYDSNKFPFYQGEVYHQYHNDFQNPAYGKDYNDLANIAYDDGRIKSTGCPDKF